MNVFLVGLVPAAFAVVDAIPDFIEALAGVFFPGAVIAEHDFEQFVVLAGRPANLRLKEGDDFPYHETNGFDDNFVQMERYLCAYDQTGKVVRDDVGNPVLECMCGNVLSGRTDPQKPFFTEAGSFWSNCTTELLATTTQEDRQARTRNRCNSEGYESVGLIPLRTEDEIVGLLQFNDRRPNQFTPEMIHFFEGLGASIGIALSKKKVQDALRQSELLHREAQKVAHIGHWELIPEIGTPSWSQEIFEIFGIDPEQGEPSFAAHQNYIHPDDWKLLNDSITKASRDGTPFDIVFRIIRPDNDLRWMHAIGSATKDAKGTITRLFGTAQDVSNYYRTLEELRESEDKHRIYVENAPDGIFVVNADGAYNDVNKAACRMTGYSKNELLNMTFQELTSPETLHESIEAFTKLRETGELETEVILRKKDGSYFIASLDAVALSEDRFMAFCSDITVQKQAAAEKANLEDQLRQSQKMEAIGRLAGGVAHDFNNLLTAILGFSELVHDSLNEVDPLRKDIEEIIKAANSAAALTQQLLAFSRKQLVTPKVVNINKAISVSEKMLRRVIGEDIDLVFAPDENVWKIMIDPGQVDQILMNLAVNARDAMPYGGQLTIETQNVRLDEKSCQSCQKRIVGKYVMLALSDNGTGMDQEIRKQIFEPFFTTKVKGEGTGLGLSAIHGIVHQANGHINVYSEPGVGTTFKIYLPQIEAEADVIEPTIESSKLTGNETILLVEDQEIVRKLAKRTLKTQGYKVIEAEHGGEAIYKFQEHKGQIDLLFTDVIMPQMTGKQLYAKLSELKPGLKVLYMSGYTENAIAHRGVLEKETNFIQKPFRPQDLAKKVRQVLDN